VKLGTEIARFEQRTWAKQAGERVYQISLRACGQTIFRQYSPKATVTNLGRRVCPWAVKFPNLDAARADYLRRGYQEIT
jgi:hypothetical protein